MVETEGAFSNLAINDAIKGHPECSPAFVRDTVKGVLRRKMLLDFYIDKEARKGLRGIKKKTLVLLRMGLFLLLRQGGMPDHAVVGETVEIAKRTARGSEGFVNAVLRNFIRDRKSGEIPAENGEIPSKNLELPAESDFKNRDEWLSVTRSFPLPLIKLLRSQYGDETERILDGLNDIPELTICANSLKISRDDLLEELSVVGIKAERSEQTERGIVIKSGGELLSGKLFRDGLFSVQSESSLLATEKLAPRPGDRVLDMCAAPGGKTFAMAEIMGDRGEIVSCDVFPHRLKLIEAGAKRLGISSVSVCENDATVRNEAFDDSFDAVLADVPCSGLGVIAAKPELRYRVDPEDLEELREKQLGILTNAFYATKPGGKLMYSTCTINKNENERITETFSERVHSVEVVETGTILPYNKQVGFFYCIMHKNT